MHVPAHAPGVRLLRTTPLRVAVIGQGYVGLSIAVRAVDVGHSVIGLDSNPQRTQRLQSGNSYIEDVSNETLQRCIDSGRFVATTSIEDCADFDVAVFTVPTPLRDGLPDLTFVEASAAAIAPFINPKSTLILESTTYPGTTEELFVPILEKGSGMIAGVDFFVGYSPERIDPGNVTWHLENTPKVVSGINQVSLEKVNEFYQTLVATTVMVSGTREAELSKLLENTFRHVNIALVNELAIFAAGLDVDIWEAIDAASTKPFGYMRFSPGPGVGGHCLPIDPSFLSWKIEQTLGSPFRFIDLANDVNSHMPEYVARRVVASLNRLRMSVNGARILIIGLAYKKNIGDGREAPGWDLCQLLYQMGAIIQAVDPLLDNSDFPHFVERVALEESTIRESDLTIIVTDHDGIDWSMVQSASRHVLDTRHRLELSPNVEYL